MLQSKSGKPSRIYDGFYPLTGILKCPKCGAGMVISRTTNVLADGTKKRLVFMLVEIGKIKEHQYAIQIL